MIGIYQNAIWNGGSKMYYLIDARRMPAFAITTAMLFFGMIVGTTAILFGYFF